MTDLTPIPFRPLGILKTVLESLGYQITHSYEDLIFIEHNAFLLRMEEQGEDVSLFFNIDSEPDKRQGIAEAISNGGKACRLKIKHQGTYQLTPNTADSTLSLELRENDI